MGTSYSSSTRGIERELIAGLPSKSLGWKCPTPGPGDVIDLSQFLLPGGKWIVDRENSEGDSKHNRRANNAFHLFNSNHQFIGEDYNVDYSTFATYYGVPERDSTSRIILRIRDPANAEENEEENDGGWVTFEYCFNRFHHEEIFEFEGRDSLLDGLLPPGVFWKYKHGRFDSKTNAVVFLNYLPYFMNHLEGEVLWNGYVIALNPNPRTRLQLIDFEVEPMNLTFKLISLRQVEIIRTNKRFKLIGKPLKGKETQILQFWGNQILKIEYVLPKDGTITLKFPPTGSNVRF